MSVEGAVQIHRTLNYLHIDISIDIVIVIDIDIVIDINIVIDMISSSSSQLSSSLPLTRLKQSLIPKEDSWHHIIVHLLPPAAPHLNFERKIKLGGEVKAWPSSSKGRFRPQCEKVHRISKVLIVPKEICIF